MSTNQNNRVPLHLFACNASDDALANDLSPKVDAFHPATISRVTYEAIAAARLALDNKPAWECISVASDMDCKSLDDALNAADLWNTGTEEFLIYRFPGLYLRLLHKHNRQAEIEFEVTFQDGLSIPPPKGSTT